MDSQFVSTATLSAQQSTRWGCFMTGLWLYSLFMTGLMVIIAFVQAVNPSSLRPSKPSSNHSEGSIALLVMFLPVVLFVLLTGIQNFRKR